MDAQNLTKSRIKKGLDQQKAAEKLGVSQPYLSLLESGKRRLPRHLAEKAVKFFDVSPEDLPFEKDWESLNEATNEQIAQALASLGYPKFSHLKKGKRQNPAQVLFFALKTENLESRITEGLPWLIFAFPEMEWNRIIKYVKVFDLQNRLGFVVSLARQLAERTKDERKIKMFSEIEKTLEKSILFREDVLCNEALTDAERKFLNTTRTKEAKKWRVLSDLSVDHLDYI